MDIRLPSATRVETGENRFRTMHQIKNTTIALEILKLTAHIDEFKGDGNEDLDLVVGYKKVEPVSDPQALAFEIG